MIRDPSCSVFFSTRPVFGRTEFAEVFGREPGERAITELLKYHLRAGNIRRISRGVFASLQKGALPEPGAVDRFLAASRLRRGAVIAYQSALEVHGYPMIPAIPRAEVQVMADGEPGILETIDFPCRFVSFPDHCWPYEGVMAIERQGLTVHVTALERTLVDLFHRYDLAGGAEGLFRSLDLITERGEPFDVDALVGFAKRLGEATAAGALGFWLDRERNLLGVTAAALEELRSLAPRHARYALGATPGSGRAATGWNVILPTDIVERYLDD